MIPEIDKLIQIQSYKHDETLHRIWETANVVEGTEEYVIVANKRTKVIESNGRFWHAKEPSVTWFYKNNWFNIIGIIKKDGVAYYCNIASPYLCDSEGLKYIDYDLDIKVLVDGTYTVLDRNEYNRHKEKMKYPEKLQAILESELNKLKSMIENKITPFDSYSVMEYYNKFIGGQK